MEGREEIGMNNAVMVLADGYGSAFNECITSVDDENIRVDPPKKLKKGKLALVPVNDGFLMPFILFEEEKSAVVCWEFCVFLNGIGWKNIDLSSLPKRLEDLAMATEKGGIAAKYDDPYRDMTDYEIIKPW
jgi:hypothetical protein